ncbi:MAG: HupE/UreJ family protein [Thalassotalea sp.]
MKQFMLVIFLLASIQSAAAHQLSTAYLTGELNQQGLLTGQWQLRGFDLDLALALDQDNNGELTWNELQSQSDVINGYLTEHLTIARGEFNCQLKIAPEFQADSHFNQGYLVANFQAQCPLDGALTLQYRALFSQDSDHKALVNISSAEQQFSRVIAQDNQDITLAVTAGHLLNTIIEYSYQGIIHIWKGTDHILFLLVLLLTSVLYREQGQWLAKQNKRAIITTTAWIVTAFTLAHSITLTATAMNWLTVNSRWVEIGIAVSVLLAAVNNVFPVVLRLAWLTFAFGLLHGMGFAGVLAELGLPKDQKFWSVLSFNVGVEIGQLCILALLLPLLIWLRKFSEYRHYGVQLTSLVIAVVALQWTFERF